MAPWPLVTRVAVLDALVGGLTRTPARSHVLRGPTGVGKTTLAAAVASTLAGRGRTVVPVVALQELRSVPLGALAPLLATAPIQTDGDVSARLGELMALIGRHANDLCSLLMMHRCSTMPPPQPCTNSFASLVCLLS